MAEIEAQLDFLRDFGWYHSKRPLLVLRLPKEKLMFRGHGHSPIPPHEDTVEFEARKIKLRDMRPQLNGFRLEKHGFEISDQPMGDVPSDTVCDAKEYKIHINKILGTRFGGAEFVHTWDFQVFSGIDSRRMLQ